MDKYTSTYDCTVKEIDGVKHFFVAFTDVNFCYHVIEVRKEIYTEFQEFKRIEKKQQNYFDRHIEHATLLDEKLHHKSTQLSILTENEVIKKMFNDELYSAIDNLPEPIRKRAILYFEYELTYKQIAEIENRSISSIRDSIDLAKLKITKALKIYFD